MDGYAKLRPSLREMIPGKCVSKALTKKDMEAIRKELETKTQDTFEEFDRMRRQTWCSANNTVLD